MSPQEQRNWALAAHLSALVSVVGVPSFVGPLVVWVGKREQDAFVEQQSREALNFNLSVLVYAVVGGLLGVLLTIVTLGLALLLVVPLAIAVAVAWLVLVCLAGYRASQGEAFRYPLTIRFVS